MDTRLWWLTQNGLIVLAAIPLVWLLARCRRLRPAEQHLLWLLLLAKLALPLVGEWPVSVMDLWEGVGPSRALTTVSGSDSDLQATYMEAIPWEVEPLEIAAEAVVSLRESEISQPPAEVATSTDVSPHWAIILGGVWLTGSCVWLLITIVQIRRQLRLLRNSTAPSEKLLALVRQVASQWCVPPIPVRVSEGVVSPCISCVGRTCLIWPAHLAEADPDGLESLVAHELAHVWRRDHWIAWLELAVTFVWWWNPAVWFVRARLHETRELACDALSLEFPAVDRRCYAEWLLQLSQSDARPWSPAPLRAGFGGLSRHSLRRRLQMVFQERASGRTSLAGLALAGLLGAAALPGWAWSQPTSEATAPQPAAAVSPAVAAPPAVPAVSAAPAVAVQPVPAVPTTEPPAAGLPAAVSPTVTASFVDEFVHEIPISGNVSRMQVRRIQNNLVIEIEMDGRTLKTVVALAPLVDTSFREYGTVFSAPPAEALGIEASYDAPHKASRVTKPTPVKPQPAATRSKSPPPTPGKNSRSEAASDYVTQSPPTGLRSEDIELAEINIQEKRLELDAALEDLTTNADAKTQRKVKLAELAVRRAEIELRRVKGALEPASSPRR